MAALEFIALDEATPQLRAPGSGDTYSAPRPVAVSIGTITTDINVLDLSATWNDAGVTFTGLKLNVTNTASAAASKLLDLQVGGVTQFSFLRSSVGSAGVPAFKIGSAGFREASVNSFRVISGGNDEFCFSGYTLRAATAGAFAWDDNNQAGNGTVVLSLYKDANDTLAQRRSTNAQEFRVYGTYTSASQYHYVAVKTAKTTLTATAGATITATDLIPDGAFLIGVTTRVNTTATTATGYTVGDGTDADLWGVASSVAAGTATSSADFTAAAACGLYIAAQSVVITATGGNFDGTGAIEVVAHYLTTVAD